MLEKIKITKGFLSHILLSAIFLVTSVTAKEMSEKTSSQANQISLKQTQNPIFEKYKTNSETSKAPKKSSNEINPSLNKTNEDIIIKNDSIANLSNQLTKEKQTEALNKANAKPIIINEESLLKYQTDSIDKVVEQKKSGVNTESVDALAALSLQQQKKYPISKDARITAHPMPSAKRTSNFGYRRIFGRSQFHKGIDFAAKYGSPIHAAGDGKVVIAGWLRGYGRVIYIDHGDGMQTRYAHNSKLLVKKGQYVKAGQQISKMGCSGRCTGPHLHFEIRINNKAVSPDKYLQGL